MKKIFFAGLGIIALCAVVLACWALLALSHLPDVSKLKHYRPAAASEVLDREGRLLTEFYDGRYRIWVPIASLPDIVIQAVVIAEDDTFFEHKGVNYKAAWDALVLDVQRRRFARGGSTITQQMIKNVLLTREKTLTRKLQEYILARRAEEVLTKRQILQIYLNEVEWGDNLYGIEAASRYYLDKHASELSPAEAALLAGMLPSPRYYNPFKRPDNARKRRDQVLFNMAQARIITDDVYQAALQTQPVLRQQAAGRFTFTALEATRARQCSDAVLEQILLRLFGDQNVYRGGLTIRTSLDRGLQGEMNRLEDASEHPSAPDRVTVVRQGDQIRALLCSAGKEMSVRERLESAGLPGLDYEVASVSTEEVTREQIIQSVEGEKKK
ncbi:MAG TPA: transglycosylase domain-containing protein [Nitrospirota bacterium]|nr:transglycosylase domain-containing protein [Nitrospirota bacterium]